MRKPLTAGNSSPSSWIRASIFLFLIIAALVSMHFTPLGQYFSAPVLQDMVDRAGFWAPLAFILFYAAGICLFIPATVLTGIGAVIFGPYWGFFYIWMGAMIGASIAFFVSRTLGRDFAASLVGEKLKRYDTAIERNGFATVLYLRLIYFPFTVLNFGMGLTRVRFSDFFWGTALGIIVGTFVITFLFGTLKEVWASGNWGGLFSFKILFALVLFVISLMIPKFLKRLKGDKYISGDQRI